VAYNFKFPGLNMVAQDENARLYEIGG